MARHESLDDSVAHSWGTRTVRVAVDVDAGIATTVFLLNTIPGVRTYASCQGHPHSEGDRRGYVHVGWTTDDALQAIQRFVVENGYSLEALSEEGAHAILRLPEVAAHNQPLAEQPMPERLAEIRRAAAFKPPNNTVYMQTAREAVIDLLALIDAQQAEIDGWRAVAQRAAHALELATRNWERVAKERDRLSRA